MAYSIIKGMTKSGLASEKDIFIYDKSKERQDKVCQQLSVSDVSSPERLAECCGIIFVAVKPTDLNKALPVIAESVNKNSPILVSVVAGKEINFIQSFFSPETKIVRIMPNVNAEISMSMTAYCCNSNIGKDDKLNIEKCLSTIGSMTEIEESFFSIFTAIAGCSPAFVYLFIDAMATAAVSLGMNKDTALNISSRAVLGSAAMVVGSNTYPHQLIDKVCSPNGATIEGILSLAENRFESTVVSAVKTAYNKTMGL